MKPVGWSGPNCPTMEPEFAAVAESMGHIRASRGFDQNALPMTCR